MTTTTRIAATLAAGLATLSLAACSFKGSASTESPATRAAAASPTSPTASPTRAPATSARASSGSAAGSAAGSAGSSASGSAGSAAPGSRAPSSSTPLCTFGQLAVALGPAEGAAGSVYTPITLRNTGSACVLQGHPGVDGVRGDGRTVHADRTGASSTGSTAAPPVVLKSGGHASALLRASDVPTGSADGCPPRFTALLVTPPDLRQSARLATSLPSCGGLTVGPVVPGTQG